MNYDITGLTKLVESASIDNKLIKEASLTELNESLSNCQTRLTESINTSEGWWVPISKYGNKNGNGRIYNRRLWENVINRQKDIWAGAPMLADHPADDSDGSPKDICGVWLDARLEGGPETGLVYGLVVPSGHLGEDLKDHLKKGLRVGTSSCGYGRILPDNVTVDPDSYMIERLSDWVLNPSQGTFFSYEECVSNDDKTTETTIKESFKESMNNKETTVKDSAKIARLEEKKFRRDMESFLEEADAIKDPQERLQEFREIKSYLEDGACPDLKERIEKKIAEEEEYIKTAIKEKAEFKEKFDVDSPKQLEEKLTKIVEDSAALDKEAKDWKAIAEKLQSKINDLNIVMENSPSQSYVNYLTSKIESLKKDIEDQKAKFYEFSKKAVNESKALKENNNKLNETIASLNEEKENINKQLSEAQANLSAANALSERILQEKNETKSSLTSMVASYNELKSLFEANKNESNTTLTEANSQITNVTEQLNQMTEAYNKVVADLQNSNKILESQRTKLEEYSKKESDYQAVIAKQKSQLKGMAKEVKEAQFRLFGERTETSRTTTSTSKSPTGQYYEYLYRNYGNVVVPFKEKIEGAITLTEAKQIFYKEVLPNLNESVIAEDTRLPEAMPSEVRAQKLGLNTKKDYMDNLLERNGWV